MNAKVQFRPFMALLFPLIELWSFLFRRPASQEVETMPHFENDNRELIKELAEREPIVEIPDESEEFMPVFLNDAANHSPDVRAPKGIALRKTVQFRAHSGEYRSAKVVGWDGDGALILSRKNGPPFRRHLTAV